MYGLESGWSGPALKLLTLPDSPFPITPIDISWLSAVATAGNILSIICCTMVAQSCGRKPLLCVCCIILIIAWLLNCFANTLVLLFVSKFFVNAGLGIYDVLNCIYMSEVASSKNRGVFVTLSIVFFTFGTEAQYIVGLFQSYQLLSIVPLCVSVVALCSLYFSVESPHFLVMQGKNEEAYKNMSILEGTGNTETVTRDYDELVRYVEEEKSTDGFFEYVLRPQNYRVFVCLMIVNSLVYVNGMSIFTGYEPIIMHPYGVNDDLVLNILGISSVVATICSPFVVAHFGRKSLMLNGFLIIGLLQVIIAFCFSVEDSNGNTVKYLPELTVFCNAIGSIIYTVTVYPVTHILRSEMLPHKLKESGSSVVVILKAIVQGILSATFFPLAMALSYGFTFFIYSIAAFVGAIYVYFQLEETKDKSLAEIRKCYVARQ